MKFKWDGKSRPSDNKYRKRWDEIFGKKEEKELKESYQQSKLNKQERKERKQTLKKEDYPWNEKESNMTEKEWNEQRDWVFSFIGKIIYKRVLH